MERQHKRATGIQFPLSATDFRHSGKEGKDIAVVALQRDADRSGDGVRQVAWGGDVARNVLDGNWILAAGAFDHVRVHQTGEAGAVGTSGHREEPEFRSQHALQVEAQGQTKVRFQGPLVDFVKDHDGDAVQPRIGLQTAKQQALGDDFDPGFS